MSLTVVACLALLALLAFASHGASAAAGAASSSSSSKSARTYVMPSVEAGMSPKSEQYLIGVISTAMVALATYLAVKAMTGINYDDDTLLMVEVPEDTHHEE